MAAAVSYSAGVEEKVAYGEGYIMYWKSPSTMDSADYVTLPTMTGKSIVLWGCWDVTGTDKVTHTLSVDVATIDALGATTNHVYVLCWGYV